MVLGMVLEALRGAVEDVRSGATAKEKVQRAASLTRTVLRELVGIISDVPYAVFGTSVWRKPEQQQQRWRFDLRRNVRYGPGGRHLLDVYSPLNCDQKSALPVVLFVHGGVWASGDKMLFSPLGAILAHHGIIALLVQYTLYPQVVAKEQVKEISRALTWALDNVDQYGGDTRKVNIMGHSSGAHLCGMLLWERARGHPSFKRKDLPGESGDVRQPNCYIGLAGVYNIGEHYKYEMGRNVASISCMKPAMEGPKLFKTMSPELLFRSLLHLKCNQKPETSRTTEAETEVDVSLADLDVQNMDWSEWASAQAPFFIFTSHNDKTVPPATSINFHRVLQELGCRSGVAVHKRLGHDDFVCWVKGFWGKDNPAAKDLIQDVIGIVKDEQRMNSFIHSEVQECD